MPLSPPLVVGPAQPNYRRGRGWCRWSLRPRQAEPGKRNEIHTRRGANDTQQLHIVRNSEKKKGWGRGVRDPLRHVGPEAFRVGRSLSLARSLARATATAVCVRVGETGCVGWTDVNRDRDS
jgi:hypothetical protein